MWHVYVLKSKTDDNNYVGMTNNLKQRIDMHNSGRVFSTKNRAPLSLIYCESFLNRNDAAVREQFMKTGWGRNCIKRSLKNYFKNLGG